MLPVFSSNYHVYVNNRKKNTRVQGKPIVLSSESSLDGERKRISSLLSMWLNVLLFFSHHARLLLKPTMFHHTKWCHKRIRASHERFFKWLCNARILGGGIRDRGKIHIFFRLQKVYSADHILCCIGEC